MSLCDWCGDDHRVERLCLARPKWSRRGFVALFGMGLVGLALPISRELTQMFANNYAVGTVASIAPLDSLDLSDLGLRPPTAIAFSGTFDRTEFRDGDVFRIRFPDGQDWSFPAMVQKQGIDGVILMPMGAPTIR